MSDEPIVATLCGAPHPLIVGLRCDRVQGHAGPHSWERVDPPSPVFRATKALGADVRNVDLACFADTMELLRDQRCATCGRPFSVHVWEPTHRAWGRNDVAADPGSWHPFALREETLMDEPILQFFAYAHLPPRLQDVSRPFCLLAHEIVHGYDGSPERPTTAPLPRNPERTVALRKLLESKDAAVRAALYRTEP